jgi:hypothetical protein
MEVYSIVGAICVVVLGWFVQLVGLSWEPVALGLAILGAGFTPRIVRSIKSRQAVEPIQTFQTFLGGDDLLKELERVEAACARISGVLLASGEGINAQIMELDYLWTHLTGVKNEYPTWNPGLRSNVTVIIDQLRDASSALSDHRDLEHTKAHINTAVRSTQELIAYLKSPPSS